MNQLAQADGYTGGSRPGLNTEASYHRMVYENRSHIASLEELQSLILELKQQFDNSTQSRLVIRALLSGSSPDSISHLDKIIARSGGQLGYYLNYQPTDYPFIYVTISFNRADRGISDDKIQRLTEINKSYIEGLLTTVGDFTEYNLTKVQDFSSKGFHLTRKMNPQELESLWGFTFGWSERACESLLESTDGSFPIGVRDKTMKLVAAVLYSHQPHVLESGEIIQHGETTEASTLPAYQGNGIMPVLVTGLHIEVLRSRILNVYGELRSKDITGDKPNSINHGIKSGKIFHFPVRSSPLLINHVSIGGGDESYNIGRSIPGYSSSPPEELRSFLLGSMDPGKISNPLKDTYSRLFD